MAGGRPNPPRPPQEDVEKHHSFSFNPFISNQKDSLNKYMHMETDPKYQNLVFGSLQTQSPIFSLSQAPSQKNRSYADIVTGRNTTDNQHKLHSSVSKTEMGNRVNCSGWIALKKATTYLGKPAIIFSDSEKQSMLQGMKYVLIAKFSHGRPSLACVKDVFTTFNLKAFYNISIYDTKHLILEFEAFDDYVHIWMQQQIVVKGFWMRLFKWREDFQPMFESPICPAWVHLPGLPLHLYQEHVLMSIANVIGKPLGLDLDNIKRSKLGCASFCVEVDVSVEVIDKIWIEFEAKGSSVGRKGIWQKVFYDRLPPYCSRCAHLGHSMEHCLRSKTIEEEEAENNRGSIGNKVIGAAAEHLSTVPVRTVFCSLNSGLTAGIGSGCKGQEVEKELVAGHNDTLVLDLGIAKEISDVMDMQKTMGAAEGLDSDYTKAGVQELQEVLGIGDGPGTDCNKAGVHQEASPAEPVAGELARVPTAGYKMLITGENSAQEVAAWEDHEDAVLEEDLTLEEGEIAEEDTILLHTKGQNAGAEISVGGAAVMDGRVQGLPVIAVGQIACGGQDVLAVRVEKANNVLEQTKTSTDIAKITHVGDDSWGVLVENEEPAEEDGSKTAAGKVFADQVTRDVAKKQAVFAEEEGVVLENTLPVVSQDEDSDEDEINGTLADLHKQVMGFKSSKDGPLVEEEVKNKNKKQDIRLTSQLSPSEVKDCAKKELAKVYSSPTSTLPSIINLHIPDKDGNAVPLSAIIEKSAGVTELSKQLSKMRNLDERLKGEHGLDFLRATGDYDKYVTWYTIEILQTLKDHSQTSFCKDSTTYNFTPLDKEVIKKGIEWSTPKRRGRDRNK